MLGTTHPHRHPLRWARVLPPLGLFVFVAIGVFVDAWTAIGLAIVCLALAGARAIASGGDNHLAKPDGDNAWAERVLAAPIPAETAAVAIEWLALVGATFLIATSAPPDAIIEAAPFISFGAIVVIAAAFAHVLWERRCARQILRSAS